jgi:hypothetical protein
VGVRESLGLDGVTTFNEFAVPLVARLAEMLCLPGVLLLLLLCCDC